MKANKPNLLITGATGFIGKRLCQLAASNGYRTRPVSRLSKGIDAISVGDLNGDNDWSEALLDIDVVVHLAARVHVINDGSADPVKEFRKINVIATVNLAKQALNAKVKRFIYISSIKVNGELTRSGEPFRHSDLPHPKDLYAASKYEAELALLELVENTSMDLIIIRPPLVYGPGVKANFLKILTLLDKGIYLPFASIENKRSLIYLDNLVDLILISTIKPISGSHIFLASDGHDLSTPELLNIMSSSLPIATRLLPFPVRLLRLVLFLIGKKSIAHRLFDSLQVDISHTENMLEWKPPISIKQGLHETVVSFLRNK